MVKKTEDFASQLNFRPVSTFERFQNEKFNFGKTMQSVTKNFTQDTSLKSSAKTAVKTESGKQTSPTGKSKAVSGALERMSQSGNREVTQTETEELPTEDVMAMLQTVVAEVKQQFMDVFGVTEQEFAAAMEKLGLTEEDLSDPEMLTKLAAELLGTEDQMELLFHSEVTDLLKEVQDRFAKISEELEQAGMDLDQVLQVLKEASVHTEEAVEEYTGVIAEQEQSGEEETEGKETAAALDLAAQTAEKETVQVTASEKNNGKQQKNLNGEDQSFSAQVLSKLEEAVNEKMPEIDARDVIRQVVEEIKLTVKADTTSFEMQLNPEHLGKINLQVAAKNGVVTAQIATETVEAKEILEAQLSTLKETLANQGVKVEAVEVSVGARSFDQNLDGQAEKNNQEAEQDRPRRFRFDIMEAEEGELTSAEQIAREIMMANGNRIDYTA